MPQSEPHLCAGTRVYKNQGPGPDISWSLDGLRRVSRGSAQGPLGSELPAVPQFCGLEGDQCQPDRSIPVRSLEDALSLDRPACPGAMRQVPYQWTRRQAAVRGYSV